MVHSLECYNRLAEQLRPGITDLIFDKTPEREIRGDQMDDRKNNDREAISEKGIKSNCSKKKSILEQYSF